MNNQILKTSQSRRTTHVGAKTMRILLNCLLLRMPVKKTKTHNTQNEINLLHYCVTNLTVVEMAKQDSKLGN